MRNACRAAFGLLNRDGCDPCAPADAASLDELVSAVVRIKTNIEPDGRTVQSLGREREGSGIVIDDDGLVLTIGYLMVEAHAAEITTNAGRTVPATIVGYDHETGFGLLRDDRAAEDQAARVRQLRRREGERSRADRELRRRRHGGAGATSPPSANSPAAGNTCSTRRSSRRRRIRPGAAPR